MRCRRSVHGRGIPHDGPLGKPDSRRSGGQPERIQIAYPLGPVKVRSGVLRSPGCGLSVAGAGPDGPTPVSGLAGTFRPAPL
jgi:hypothetical protein